MAETTTTTAFLFCLAATTLRATSFSFSTVATEEPPYFWTMISNSGPRFLVARSGALLEFFALDRSLFQFAQFHRQLFSGLDLVLGQQLGQRADRYALVKLSHRKIEFQLLLEALRHLDGDQGIASQVKKIVVKPYLLEPQHALPDRRNALFQFGFGADVSGGQRWPGMEHRRGARVF